LRGKVSQRSTKGARRSQVVKKEKIAAKQRPPGTTIPGGLRMLTCVQEYKREVSDGA